MYPIIGIDVANGRSVATAWKDSGMPFGQVNFLHTVSGLAQLQDILDQLEQACGVQPEVILEATGHYSMPLCRYFQEHHYTFRLLNPYVSRQFNRLGLRKVKTDRVDSENLCRLYYQERLYEQPAHGYNFDDRKALGRALAEEIKNLVRQRVRLSGHMDRCFPGFRKLFCSKYGDNLLALLAVFPHPDLVTGLRPNVVTLKVRSACHTHTPAWCRKKAHELRELARDCYPAVPLGHFQVQLMVEAAVQLSSQLKRVSEYKRALIDSLRSDPQFIALTSIPGLGEYQAAAFLAEIGDVRRFSTVSKLIAFCGVEPSIFQSGAFTGTRQHLTKRGNAHLRALLYMAVVGMVHFKLNPVLLAYYEKKRLREGKPYKVAIFACVNKLLRIIFAICAREERFSVR